MKRTYLTRYLPGHPLASKNGKVGVGRLVLWESVNGADVPCHWCGDGLVWGSTLCADHLDGDTHNNAPENIVAACRGCNANRSDGTGHGRRDRSPKPCESCGTPFVARRENHAKQRHCGHACAARAQWDARGRGTRASHGTVTRYKGGCRCTECRQANSDKEYLRRHGSIDGNRRGHYNIPN